MTQPPADKDVVDHFVRGLIYLAVLSALTQLLDATNAAPDVAGLLTIGVFAAFLYMVLPYAMWGWGIAIDRLRAWEGESA